MIEIVLSEIDRIISESSKRDLVPAHEVINQLLDLRNAVETTVDPDEELTTS